MSAMAQGLMEVLVIQGLYLRVLMGEAHRHILVNVPENVAAGLRQLLSVMDRLSAAAGAAAGTGHDLHEIVAGFPLLQSVHQLTGIAQAADHRHTHLPCSGDLKGGFLPAVHTADSTEGIGIRIPAGDQIVGTAQRSVHYAAGGAEDHRRAGTGAQRAVKLCFLQHCRVDLLAPQHAVELTGGQHHIHIRIAAGVVEIGDGPLRFFGGAGHDGHHEYIMGIHTDLFRKVALGYRAEHCLRRLGRRQVAGVLRKLSLDKPYPAGAAGGKHGPLVLIPVSKPLQELTALFHDGQVSGEVGIKDIVKAHRFQCCDHTLGGGKLGIQMVVLRPCGPYGRGDLHHRDLLGIRQRIPHLSGIVMLLQSAHRAVGDALTAEGAVRLTQRAEPAHAYCRAGTGANHIPDVHALDLIAHLNAAHAADAAVLNAHHGIGEVVFDVLQVLDVMVPQQVIVVAQLLQLAVAAAGTLGAVVIMLAQQQPQIDAPCLAHTGRVGMYHHAFRHRVVAGGHQSCVSLHLHHADAAGGDLIDIL